MFQLIVTVISIALVAALAIASIFYGGAAFSGSSAKTAATTLINGGQQISGAVALFRTDNGGVNPADVQALIDGEYLQSAPAAPKGVPETSEWTLNGNVAYIQLGTLAAEEEVDVKFGLCERVESDNGAGEVASVATDTATMNLSGVPFDCVLVNSVDVYFAYKI